MRNFLRAEGYGVPAVFGSSTWLQTNVLLAYRVIAFFATIIVFSVYTAKEQLKLQYLTVWTLYLSGISYGIGALGCVSSLRWFAKLGTVCYHVFLTFSLLVTPIYWVLEFPDARSRPGVVTLARLYPHGVTVALFLVDLLLGGQLEFRFFDVLWVIVYGVVYIVFVFIRFGITGDIPYDFLDFRKVGAGQTVLTYFLIIVGGVVAGSIVVLISRVTRLYRKREVLSDEERQ